MCLINFQYKKHPKYKLAVAANRDEFYERPTAAAHFWEDEPQILAGRDLMQMGTWLGVTTGGRFSALTNFRDPSMPETGKISRGAIVRNFLAGDDMPESFLSSLDPGAYTGFNVLAGDLDSLYYFNNIQGETIELAPGTYGLSNHFLDTPWPKVVKGKKYLEEYLALHEEVEVASLFEMLLDAEQAEESHLPNTGVGLEFERKLSPLFIKTPGYGTRSATVLLIDYDNNITFSERVFEEGVLKEENKFKFKAE